jgi:hypothetical protein
MKTNKQVGVGATFHLAKNKLLVHEISLTHKVEVISFIKVACFTKLFQKTWIGLIDYGRIVANDLPPHC